MNIGFHHFLYKYNEHNPLICNPKFKFVIEKGVYAIGFLGVIVILPQALDIWIGKNSSGVSLITWVGFLIGSFFWFFYGVIHKEKPIILANLAVILADLTVIIGIIRMR